MQFSPLHCHFVSLRPKYPPQHPILRQPQPMFLPQCERPSKISHVKVSNSTHSVRRFIAEVMTKRSISLQRLRKTTENIGQNSRFLGYDSNRDLHEILATALTIHKKTYVKRANELNGTVPSKSAKQKVSNVGACFQRHNFSRDQPPPASSRSRPPRHQVSHRKLQPEGLQSPLSQ